MGLEWGGFHEVPGKQTRREKSIAHEFLCNLPYPARHKLFLSIFLNPGSITLSLKESELITSCLRLLVSIFQQISPLSEVQIIGGLPKISTSLGIYVHVQT